MTIKLDPRSLKGKSANSLLADFMGQLSSLMKKKDDPTLTIEITASTGQTCMFEFRAMSVPGEFQRTTINVTPALEEALEKSGVCFACGQASSHLIGFPPQCPSCYGDNG